MSKTTTTETRYAVARGAKILGHELGHGAIETARAELEYVEARMREIGLEPDVRLVQFDLTSTHETSRPTAYREPADEPTPEADAPQGNQADQAGTQDV